MPVFSATPTGTRIALRIQPRAARTDIVGVHGDVLRVRVAAPPVDGAANEMLLRFLADRLRLPRSAVELAVGRSSRSKAVIVTGLAPQEVAKRLSS